MMIAQRGPEKIMCVNGNDQPWEPPCTVETTLNNRVETTTTTTTEKKTEKKEIIIIIVLLLRIIIVIINNKTRYFMYLHCKPQQTEKCQIYYHSEYNVNHVCSETVPLNLLS